MRPHDLVLGIDGGGTHTVAWLARLEAGEIAPVGRGTAGASNPRRVGFDQAARHLEEALAGAVHDARCGRGSLAAACLGLAGCDRPEERHWLTRWHQQRALADRVEIAHDGRLVVAAGTPDDWGIGLISGTGSLAFARSRAGDAFRSGGWGYLIGDEGSAYDIGRQALVAAVRMADGRGPSTPLLKAVLQQLELQEPAQLIGTLYDAAAGRHVIGQLAPLVSHVAADGDTTARRILDRAAADLAEMVAAVGRRLPEPPPWPLAVAGGHILGDDRQIGRLEQQLVAQGIHCSPLRPVPDPVAGAIVLARQAARSVT